MTTTVLDRLRGRTLIPRSRFLIGADGGNSRVAGSSNRLFTADLSQYVAQRPGAREDGDRRVLPVGPDQMIAWRAASRSQEPEGELRQVLGPVLARDFSGRYAPCRVCAAFGVTGQGLRRLRRRRGAAPAARPFAFGESIWTTKKTRSAPPGSDTRGRLFRRRSSALQPVPPRDLLNSR